MPDARTLAHDQAVAGIMRREGCRLEAYADPVKGWAVPTIGYGSTGPGIVRGTVWTEEQARADLEHRLAPILDWAFALRQPPLPPGCVAALASLAWNVGVEHLETGGPHGDESHLVKLVRAGQLAQAADAFLVWDHVGGEVVPGLLTRRHEERAEFLAGLKAVAA